MMNTIRGNVSAVGGFARGFAGEPLGEPPLVTDGAARCAGAAVCACNVRRVEEAGGGGWERPERGWCPLGVARQSFFVGVGVVFRNPNFLLLRTAAFR